MKQFGHREISFLKIDIEGFEYDVLSSWQATEVLPVQVSVEVHYRYIYFGTSSYNNSGDYNNLYWPLHEVSLADISLFANHLANLGYGIVSKEDNERCPHCTEITILRLEHL